MPNPQLLVIWTGATVGFALVLWASWRLAKTWDRLTKPRRWIFVGAAAAFELFYWVNVYAWLIEPRMLVVHHVEISSEDWHGPPLTIAVIADTHVGGPHVDAARVGRIVARVNALRPELVVLLGDYAAGHAPEAERSPADQQEVLGGIATFAVLTSRYGVVAVLGNHDSWYGRQSITTALQDAGVTALWNRNVVIPRSGRPLVVAGVADDWTGDPDFAAALEGAPAGADILMLSHSPDPFVDLPRGPALMLAAHSHCGQVTIPLVGRLILPIRHKRFACHLVRENGRVMYVTGGIGTSILPIRFLNPPEVVLVRVSGAEGP